MTIPNRSKADRSRDEVLAGEYVLGALDARARRSAKARMRRDRTFAAMVDRWQENLVDPDDIQPEPNPVDYAIPPQYLYRQKPERRPLGALWNSVGFWRTLSAGSIFGFGTFLLFYLSPAIGPQPKPLTAEMAVHGNDLNLQAHYDHRTAMLHVVPVAAGAQATERALQIWLIDREGPPRSLGLLESGKEASVLVPTRLRRSLQAGATFAVSVEPPGGSTSGQATGPLIAMGAAHF